MEACTVGELLSPAEVLGMVPQQEPFRFIDEIVELDQEHIVARYTFPEDSDFYRGHFPGNPITPGVILIETAAQAGVVAFGIFLYAADNGETRGSCYDHGSTETVASEKAPR
jgi:3-hydroxymyristoyl/3-hydroxydecanoyl-(acyl carrier protein) dehydratase